MEHETCYVAVVNTKGGVGKTTTAMYLAFALTAVGHSAEVRDADPQGSASEWADRIIQSEACPFEVIAANNRTVGRPSASQWVIIDTPPGAPQTVSAAIGVADFVIVPTTSTPIDLERTFQTIEVLKAEGKAFAVLLTITKANTIVLENARKVLEEYGAPLFEVEVPQRELLRQYFGRIPTDLITYPQVLEELKEALS